MKRKQEDGEGEETLKRLASPASLVPGQYLVQPQQLTTVQLLTPTPTGPILGAPSGVHTVGALTVPTAVAVAVQSEHSPVGADPCLLGGTITYTQPSSHSPTCNIVLATPQPYATTSIPVTGLATLPNSNTIANSISVSDSESSAVLHPSDSRNISYATTTVRSDIPSYSNTSAGSNICIHTTTTPQPRENSVTTYNNPDTPSYVNTPSTSTSSTPVTSTHNTYAIKRSLEPPLERQQRLSKKFDALIRSKIIELVQARGVRKTVCPSEVARALSPKAWRDLMPAVRKIGAQLVKEGLILVTQRGTIVDLATAQGPVRFGLAG
ncbi:LOW QUALITY PROTEIN: exocyst complex component 5-like [Penaeus monodon]|uniref:LOW QUALITY PROTEIN: exocyst complex component 5-like n=1 Tax=Penaeus monodon TaxID=6687 RepID=UPI0018A7B423|nr:LOW QUALITY PROTEIN: exocyst complex component 5-like [Penaeus monodon]